MSHTNHRTGTVESLKDDYVVLAISAPGINRDGCVEKMRILTDLFLKHNPDYMGVLGWPDPVTRENIEEIKAFMTDKNGPVACFNRREDIVALIRDLKELDLGMSIIVSGLFGEVHKCCRENGITPHTVNMSLGIWGKTDMLPQDSHIVDLSTMCGHGMIPFSLVTALLDKVKNGRMTPEEAAERMGETCTCRIFNRDRAAKIIREAAEI